MSADTVYDIIGYVASALIVISLAMSSIIRLRVLNLIGALVFSLYGVLIGAIPVIVTNGIIAVLDVWYLRKELTTREELTVVAVGEGDPFLEEFMAINAGDLATYGDPAVIASAADVRFVMLRDANPAGVFLGRRASASTLEVLLDYVAPRYRDLQSGASLYRNDGERFRSLGYERLEVPSVDARQRSYFAKMGFADAGSGRYVRNLAHG